MYTKYMNPEQFPSAENKEGKRPYPSEEEKLKKIRERMAKAEKKKPDLSYEEQLAAIRARDKGKPNVTYEIEEIK